MHPDVWRASGHVENFSDPLVECRNCHQRFRADHIEGDQCPNCGETGTFTEPQQFNLMFETNMGPIKSPDNAVHLRPETAQGIFVNFNNVLTAMRRKLPFGIAQIGKAFRNEITTGNFIFRTREFEMMEIEFFVHPGQDEDWHTRWTDDCMAWYTGLGVDEGRLRRESMSPRSWPTTLRRPPTSSTSSRGAGARSRASPTGPTSTSVPTRMPAARSLPTSTRRPRRTSPPSSSSLRRGSTGPS